MGINYFIILYFFIFLYFIFSVYILGSLRALVVPLRKKAGGKGKKKKFLKLLNINAHSVIRLPD
jgi:hypothetical protein